MDQSDGLEEERRGASSFSLGLRDHLKTNAFTLSEMVSQEDSGAEGRHNLAIFNRICCCVENSPQGKGKKQGGQL